jgi:hypothetical protein
MRPVPLAIGIFNILMIYLDEVEMNRGMKLIAMRNMYQPSCEARGRQSLYHPPPDLRYERNAMGHDSSVQAATDQLVPSLIAVC